jgi:hypothetical protein
MPAGAAVVDTPTIVDCNREDAHNLRMSQMGQPPSFNIECLIRSRIASRMPSGRQHYDTAQSFVIRLPHSREPSAVSANHQSEQCVLPEFFDRIDCVVNFEDEC